MEFLGGGLSGGLFGILGGLGTSWLKMKADERAHKYKLEEMKAKQEYNLKMVEVETTATLREIDANVKRDQIMMDGKADVEESKGRNAAILKLSQNYLKASLIERMMFNTNKWSAWITVPVAIAITFMHGLVDISRTLVRVLVTYASVVFSMYITYMAFGMYKELGIDMTSVELHGIIITMLTLLSFTTSTAIGFWFMDKSMSRKFQNKG